MEKIEDHAVVAYDKTVKASAVLHQGTYEHCKRLVQAVAPSYPHIRMVVVDKDMHPVYGVRVIRIDLTAVLVGVALVLAIGAYIIWG